MNPLEEAVLRLPKPSVWKGQRVTVAEEKKNGVNCTIWRNQGGARAIGRKHYIDLWPRMERNAELQASVYDLPMDTVVNGELWVPGGKSADVVGALNAGKGFMFTAHTMPFWHGVYQRLVHLNTIRETLDTYGFDLVGQMDLLDRVYTKEETEVCIASLLKDAEAAGWEGWVLKEEHLFGWYKVKVLHTVDAVVMSTKPGNGKFEGGIGSFAIGLWQDGVLVPVGTVSAGCWNDLERSTLSDAEIGRVMEVRYQDVLGKGKLQHSVFVQWRDDKPSAECTMEQIS